MTAPHTRFCPIHEHALTPRVCPSGTRLVAETFIAWGTGRDIGVPNGACWRLCEHHLREGVAAGYLAAVDTSAAYLQYLEYCEACEGQFTGMWRRQVTRADDPT
jgi:hypothetical protein